MVNQRLLVSANTRLHVVLQCHDVTSTLIAIQCNSLHANCRFLKTGLLDHIGVRQTPTILSSRLYTDVPELFLI